MTVNQKDMNFKTIVLTLFLAIGFSISFQNCDLDDDSVCNCPTLFGEYFDITGFDLTHNARVEDCCQIAIAPGQGVVFDDYLNLTLSYFVSYYSRIDAPQPRWNFSLMNEALACTCIENGWKGSMDEVLDNITITTLYDFDEQHAANDTINEFFQVNLGDEVVALDTYLERDSTAVNAEFLFLELKKAPEAREEFQVRVKLDLSTGESYERESTVIRITE